MNQFNQLSQEEEDEFKRKQQQKNLFQEKQQISAVVKYFFIISVLFFIFSSVYRIKQFPLRDWISNQNIWQLQDSINSKLQERQIVNQEILVKLSENQDMLQWQIKRNEKINKRISMGEPNGKNRNMRIVKIYKQQLSTKSQCLLINGISVISLTTISTIESIFSHPSFSIAIIILDSYDPLADQLWRSLLINGKQKLKYIEANVTVDSEYRFIRRYVKQCEKIIYSQSYFSINFSQASSLDEVIEKKYKTGIVLFPFRAKIKQSSKQLMDLNKASLQHTEQKDLNQYLFIFDASYLRLITPLNYAFYAKYTVQQLIIHPILAIAQGSSFLLAFQQEVYSFEKSFTQFKQFSIHQVNKYKHIISKTSPKPFKRSQDFCFVSYPISPTQLSFQQFQKYFSSLIKIQKIQNSTLIINLPYSFNPISHNQSSEKLWNYYNFLNSFSSKQFNIRLRIRVNRTVSSLSAYEAAYTYCPLKSILITSRHNIKFSTNFLTQLQDNLSLRYHYYYCNHISQENKIDLPIPPPRYKKRQMRQKAMYYKQYFQNLQIFKSDLFKMMYFWILKKKEIDFYSIQASYVIPLLQMVRFGIGIIRTETYTIFQSRPDSMIQVQELNSLKLYFEWTIIPQNMLTPFKYNSLQNEAFRRWAPTKIPKIIHQAWIGSKAISAFQQKLHKTIITANENFTIKLWKDQNITIQKFPLTYSLIKRSLQYQRFSNRSYSAPIVSLIRYQTLYREGGVYIDFKTEGKKDLTPFLKYQIFFIDLDYDNNHYIRPLNVGNGIMGAIKNNYYLKLVLTELINQDKFNYKFYDFPKIVGGYILRKSLTDRELFTKAGYGFQLFSQKPGTGKPNLCSMLESSNVTKDQQVFHVTDYQTGKEYKIGIPCDIYKQSYLIMYKVLAGTWRQKRKKGINNNMQYVQRGNNLKYNDFQIGRIKGRRRWSRAKYGGHKSSD